MNVSYTVSSFDRDSFDGSATYHYWAVKDQNDEVVKIFDKTTEGFDEATAWMSWLNNKVTNPDDYQELVRYTKPHMGRLSKTWYAGRYDSYFYLGGGLEIHWARNESHSSDRSKSNNIYVDGYEEVSDEGLEHTMRGDDPEMDKAWDRHNRQIVKNMRALIKEVTEHPNFEFLPVKVTRALTEKLSFSRYAGCSCPCSPGFRSKENFGIKADIWISKK